MIDLVYVVPSTGRTFEFCIPGKGFEELLNDMDPVEAKRVVLSTVKETIAQYGLGVNPPDILLYAMDDEELIEFMTIIATEPEAMSQRLYVSIAEEFAVHYSFIKTGALYTSIGMAENAMLLSATMADRSTRIAGVTYEQLQTEFISYALDRRGPRSDGSGSL